MTQMDIHNNIELEIDLGRVFRAVMKKAWFIVIAAVLSAAIVFAGTYFFVTPQYESAAMFYVNNSNQPLGDASGSISSGDLSTARSLVDSYIVILNTRETLTEVIDHSGVSYTYQELKSMISAAAVNDTEIFRVKVTCPDPQEAARMANSIGDILPKRIGEIMEGTSARVAEAAVVPTSPCSPSYIKNTVVGFFLSFLVSVGLIVLREIFDTTIREEEDVAQTCKHPILTSVPDMAVPGMGGGYYECGAKQSKQDSQNPEPKRALMGPDIGFAAAEAYKLLRTKLLFSFADEQDCHIIGISSAISGEGKSLTAVNLAYTLAQLEKKVLLVDCDMRRPTLAEKLGIPQYPGLSDYLARQSHLKELVQSCAMKGDTRTFHVIPAGHNPPNPSELLSSPRMKRALEAMRQAYDYVILDIPPVGEVSDALTIAKYTDGMLVVVRQNCCHRKALADAVNQLNFIDARILGVVLNAASESGRGYGKRYEKNGRRMYEL